MFSLTFNQIYPILYRVFNIYTCMCVCLRHTLLFNESTFLFIHAYNAYLKKDIIEKNKKNKKIIGTQMCVLVLAFLLAC